MPSSVQRHRQNEVITTTSHAMWNTDRTDDPILGSWSMQALGEELNVAGSQYISAAYTAASRVIAYPFELCEPYLVVKVWWANGATVGTDSVDVGVYNEPGTSLLVSGGSTLSAGANLVQEKDCTDTLIGPGRYWCAIVCGGTTATFINNAASVGSLRSMGIAQQAGSGSTLGSTFTPAAAAAAYFPLFGIANRTQVA